MIHFGPVLKGYNDRSGSVLPATTLPRQKLWRRPDKVQSQASGRLGYAAAMSAIAYTVRAHCPDPQTAREYARWLRDGHLDRVIAGGALSATVLLLDPPAAAAPSTIEVRYLFPTRERLDRYLKEFAPALRAEGLQRFPPERGITYERTVGEIL